MKAVVKILTQNYRWERGSESEVKLCISENWREKRMCDCKDRYEELVWRSRDLGRSGQSTRHTSVASC